MSYTEKNGQKCEYQYCVVLKEGKDAGLKHYVWVGKATIDKFFENFEFGDGCNSAADMGHIIGQGKSKIRDKIHYVKGQVGSLLFDCQNEYTANKCAQYFKLPLPFLNTKTN